MSRYAERALRASLGYKKFQNDAVSVLVIDSDYHVQRDAIATLPKLGCQVHTLNIKVSDSVTLTLNSLIDALSLYKPDFVFSVNYLGFDDTYRVGDFLNLVGFPTVVYCVDSPLFILPKPQIPAAKVSTTFVWEKTLIPLLQVMGAKDVHYLPLGSDPDKFKLRPENKIDKRFSFVGDSMSVAQDRMRARLSSEGVSRSYELAEILKSGQRLDTLLETLTPREVGLQDKRQDIWRLAVWTATAGKRFSLLKTIKHDDLSVYGDSGWHRVMPTVNLMGRIPYGEHVSDVYASSYISINSTNCQMPTAVNQRVFDVPLSGGFILTDAQEEMHELFNVGIEAITYSSVEDFHVKAKYYFDNPSERDKVIQAGRERVLRDHTYASRFKVMLDVLKKRWR
jgi:spore maturation protein CgeB